MARREVRLDPLPLALLSPLTPARLSSTHKKVLVRFPNFQRSPLPPTGGGTNQDRRDKRGAVLGELDRTMLPEPVQWEEAERLPCRPTTRLLPALSQRVEYGEHILICFPRKTIHAARQDETKSKDERAKEEEKKSRKWSTGTPAVSTARHCVVTALPCSKGSSFSPA